MAHSVRITTVLASLLALAALAAASRGQTEKKPKARIDLVSSVESIVPGTPFEVGVRFVIDPGWHIYWQNSGESGMPPSAKWNLPAGFSVSDLRFPVPQRHYDPGPIVTNILEGKPVLLATVSPPDIIPSEKVTIAADIVYFVCAKQCIRDTTSVKIELPVTAAGAAVKPASVRVFDEARAARPKTSSDQLSISTTTKPADLVPGKTFEYTVTVKVADGLVIAAPKPGTADLTGADLFVHSVPGLFFDETRFPEGEARVLGSHGTVATLGGTFTIRVTGEVDIEATGPFNLGGLLVFQACTDSGACRPAEAVEFFGAGTPGPGVRQGAVSPPVTGWLDLLGKLIACFVYGLFINATPCVLPLLSIKVLGFVQQAHQSRSRTLALGLSFGAGVMLFFVILGFIAAGGENILQYPAAVIGLGAVVMALALSMLGVYTLQVPTAASQLEASIQKEGLLSSFGKGALAPVLGFACTGPLLAAAFGWAVQQPSHIAVLAFLCAGFGMALPYMLLGANPHWLSFLPRPGQWMVSFERVMGFLLLGMVIWLLHPLITQLGVEGLEWTLAFLVAVAFACWVIGQVDFSMSTAARWTYRGGALAMVLVAGGLIFEIVYPLQEAHERARASGADHTLVNGLDPLCPIPWQLWDPKTAMEAVCDDDPEHLDYAAALHDVCRANFNAVWTGGIPWQAWSPELVQRAVTAGRPVFVDFTAAYCTVCKANKRIAINTDEVRQKMMTLGVVPYRGDFTNGDDRIADILRTYDRAGVPLNLIYPANRPDQPIVLTPNLTKAYLLAKLDEAATNRADSPPFQQTTLRAARPSIP